MGETIELFVPLVSASACSRLDTLLSTIQDSGQPTCQTAVCKRGPVPEELFSSDPLISLSYTDFSFVQPFRRGSGLNLGSWTCETGLLGVANFIARKAHAVAQDLAGHACHTTNTSLLLVVHTQLGSHGGISSPSERISWLHRLVLGLRKILFEDSGWSGS